MKGRDLSGAACPLCSLEQGAGWLSTDTVLKRMGLPESQRGQATAQAGLIKHTVLPLLEELID